MMKKLRKLQKLASCSFYHNTLKKLDFKRYMNRMNRRFKKKIQKILIKQINKYKKETIEDKGLTVTLSSEFRNNKLRRIIDVLIDPIYYDSNDLDTF